MKKSIFLLLLSILTSTVVFSQQPKYLTGTITKNQQVEVSDISKEDSYYSEKDRFIGKKGHPGSDMTSGSDGYYSGTVKFDDGTSNYFYKIRFVEPANSVTSQTSKVSSVIPPAPSNNSNSGTKATNDFDPYLGWDSADNDLDLLEGDRVIVTAINPEDEKYKDHDLYIGKKGTLKSDVEFFEDFFEEYYSGTIKFDNGREAYFNMVKLKDASKKSK